MAGAVPAGTYDTTTTLDPVYADAGADVSASGIAGGLGAIAAGAGYGGLALEFYSGIGDLLFSGANGWGAGEPGFSNPGSYQDAFNDAVNTNSPQTLANSQLSQQQIAEQIAAAQAGGAGPGAAVNALGSGVGTGVSNATAGSILPQFPVNASSLFAGGGIPSGALAGLGGAGTGLIASGMGTSPAGASQYSALQNLQASDPTIVGDGSGSAPGGGGPVGTGSTIGSTLGTVSKYAPIVTAGASLLGGLTGATSGTGLSTSAPNPATVAGGILQDEINFAPSVYSTTAQYAPQYSALQNQMLGSSASNVANIYGTTAPQLQGLQTSLNAQQAQGNINLLGQYGSSAISAYQAANPQLQALQNQYTALAQSSPSPVGQISGAGSWASPYAQQVGQTVAGSQVNPGMTAPSMMVGQGNTQTLGQLNQTAQQQLALGSSVSQQEASTVANSVLSNYNQMGRANDPTAIAGLATSLDTYGQNLLNTREQNAATVAGLQTSQNQVGLGAGQANLAASQQSALANQSTNLAAQQSNQAAALQGLGLTGSALQYGGAQSLASMQSNQQAQLANAGYQQSLLQGASTLAQSTAASPYAMLLSQSGGISNAYNSTAQAGTSLQAGQALSGMYNPFNSAAYGPAYTAQANANTTNATTNAGLIGGGLSLLGSINSAAGAAGGYSNLFG